MIPKGSRRLVAIAALLFFAFLTFAFVLSFSNTVHNDIIRLDYAVDAYINPFRAFGDLARVMLFITYLGNPEIIIAFELCLIAFIVLVHRKRVAALFLGGIVVGEIASLGFKYLLARARPEETVFHVSRHGYSFPSGHALLSMVFYGCLGFFAVHLAHKQWQKTAISLCAGLIIFGIGLSRVYLGVHWASDVIGGWILGGACVLGIAALFYKIHHHTKGESLRSLSKGEAVSIVVVSLMVGFFVVYYFVTHLGELRSIV